MGFLIVTRNNFVGRQDAPKRHMKDKRKETKVGNFCLDGSSHQTEDSAFSPATPQDLQHSRADSHNLHNTKRTRVKQKALCFMQKDTQPSQTCSGVYITPNPTPKSMWVPPLCLWGV